jgi:hypothetical protein
MYEKYIQMGVFQFDIIKKSGTHERHSFLL